MTQNTQICVNDYRIIKKILILCDIFPPAFAPRMGYLCKYLPGLGWEPIVISEYIPQNIFRELSTYCPNTTFINYYQHNHAVVRTFKYAFVFLADFFFGYKDRMMTKIAQRQIKSHNISLILTSSHRFFPLRTAHTLSQKNNLPLVVDLRDIIEQFPGNEHISKKFTDRVWLNRILAGILTKKLLRQRNFVLKDADAVTTVSPWHVAMLKQFATNVQLVYNGFDPELFVHKKIINSEFKITYTGRLMSAGLRDPSLLFEAVSNLHASNQIEPLTFRIQFYTDDESVKILSSMAAQYHISKYVDCFDYVSNQKIPDILNESSVLLLLTNKSNGDKTPQGIMTTKIFEYMAVEKPVLCVRNDEGCLEETIRETRSGIAAGQVEQVELFLMEKYAEWKQTGYTHQKVDRQKVGQFSRSEQAKQYAGIFQRLVKT
ncbi:MAG: hypothetical protein LBE79_13635 [Tannerella sp.]|jgi:hypothetical protein|nr:hypothetical protein [Tannerella sp.]